MVQRRRNQKGQSLLHVAKDNAQSFLAHSLSRPLLLQILIVVLPLIGCANKRVQVDELKLEKKSTIASDKAPKFVTADPRLGSSITLLGDNTSPSWSPDGEHLLFVSRNRPAHKNAQVYEFDFKTNKERRITYSDGEDSDPQYVLGGNKIVYASTTDELKERPKLFGNELPTEQNPPTEIYLSDLSGIEIQRLTHHPGFVCT
jgi:Tol biopolymer transport system component